MGWWSWCCDSRDCGGLRGDTWNWCDCDCDCDCVLGGCGVVVFVVI